MKKPLFTTLLSAITLLLICGITQRSYAQTKDELLKVYDSATIHSIGKFYIKGGNKLHFVDLQNEFTSGITKDLYRKAKAGRVWGGIFSVTSISALVAGILVRKNNATLGNVLSGFAIALNLGGLHFNKRSTEQTDRAIWQRNREILFGIK
jgi:hypothetical protein